nr:DNA mismatch repair endonuclease MutL [Tissierella sp.]
MGKIKILDESTIQQIAAGEVIERPASIVKELIENSIDAKSDSIIIEIQDGGKSYIRITDNGDGMSRDDIELAFKRHATSKLVTIEDIYNVLSLGFRGEALASVASVSKVEVLSKTNDSNVGVQVFIEDGKIIEENTIGCPKGTTIIIRDIFYNLPVRKKFLKSSNVESANIGDIINKLALGNSNVSFKFIKDGNNALKTPNDSNLLNSIYSVLGKDYHKNLIPIEYSNEELKLSGYISNNNLYRSNRNHQYLYINRRYISHLNISKIIEKEYRSLIPLNRLPVFIINIEIKPNDIDINIHPTKQEVKFANPIIVYDTIAKVVREILMPSVVVPEMKLFKDDKDVDDSLPELFNEIEILKEEEDIESNSDENKVNYSENQNIVVKDFTLESYDEDKTIKEDALKEDVFSFLRGKNERENRDINKSFNFTDQDEAPVNSMDSINKNIYVEQKIEDILLDLQPIGRVFKTYIIAESRDEEKLFFIDQHAAHERVMYEKFRNEYKNEKIVTQQLISPDIVELTHEEMDIVIENKQLFEEIGFILDEFGDNSIAIRGVPMLFGKPKTKDLFLNLIDGLSDNISVDNFEIKIDKIMKISCTNAIKSGDKMDNLEIMALLDSLKKCVNPYTCPHGRPTIIELSKKDIEKQFLRII